MTPIPSTTAVGARETTNLWCMHIAGPDELHAAPDFWTALAWAAELNASIARKAGLQNWAGDENYPLAQATAQPWLGSPALHAESLKKEMAQRAAHEERRRSAEARPQASAGVEALRAKIQWAIDTLYEINPNNYDEHEVARLNDASVEVVCGLQEALRTHVLSPTPSPGEAVEDWREDPAADERWNAGLDYGMTQLCACLDIDVRDVCWDAATETLEGDVRAVVGHILRGKFGDAFDFKAVVPLNEGDTAPSPGEAGRLDREAVEAVLVELEGAANDMLLSIPAHWHDDATIRLMDAAEDARKLLCAPVGSSPSDDATIPTQPAGGVETAWRPEDVSPPEALYAWLLRHYEETDPTKGQAFKPVARKLVEALGEFIAAEIPTPRVTTDRGA